MKRKIMKSGIPDSIQLRLKAPIIVLKQLAEDKAVPKVFIKAALEEVLKAEKLSKELRNKINK